MNEVFAWALVWVTSVAAFAVVGAILGTIRPFRKRHESRDAGSARLGSGAATLGMFVPILYWWWLALQWAIDTI